MNHYNIGKNNPRYGVHLSEETKEKLRRTKLAEKNHEWKGDLVSYRTLHQWVQRHKPKPDLCMRCGLVPPYDLANISGEYKRDLNDYEYICRRCHHISHDKHLNFNNWRSRGLK